MAPIDFTFNFLGDAAAAEEMVKQYTRNERPDRVVQNDIFEEQLRLAMERSRLVSVRPAASMDEIESAHTGNNQQSRNRRRHRAHPKAVSPLHELPPTLHEREELQPMLFTIHTDRTMDEYHRLDAEPDLGNILDRTA